MRLHDSAEAWCTFYISIDYRESKLSDQCCISDGGHLNETVLGFKAAKHLAHFFLEFLASARGMPWFKREFNDDGVGRVGEVSGWVDECPLAVGGEVDNSAKFE